MTGASRSTRRTSHLQLVELGCLLDLEKDLVTVGRDDLDVQGVLCARLALLERIVWYGHVHLDSSKR